MLVLSHVAQDETHRIVVRLEGTPLESHDRVFHLRHATVVLGLRLCEEIRFEPARGAGILPVRIRGIDVNRNEQRTLPLVGNAPAVAQGDKRVGRAGHDHGDAAQLEFACKASGDTERNVFFLHCQPTPERPAHARIHAAVSGVDHHRPRVGTVGRQQTRRPRRGRRSDDHRLRRGRRSAPLRRRGGLRQPRDPQLTAFGIPGDLTPEAREEIGEQLERQQQRILVLTRRGRQWNGHAVTRGERRPLHET